MNVKNRLILSNSLTIIIPIIITLLTAFGFIFVSSKFFNSELSKDTFMETAMTKSILIDSLKTIPYDNSEIILSSKFQDNLYQKVKGINGVVAIVKDDNVLYTSKEIRRIDIEKCLKKVSDSSPVKEIKLDNVTYLMETSEFKLQNGSTIDVILLAPTKNNTDIIGKFLVVVILCFVFSSIIVNLIMSHMFSRRIIVPLSQLKNAALKISSGDLNSEIIEDGDTEINELCHSLEIMRLKLKDSINEKIRYDDNRKLLISSISHDLKTPITSIKGYVEGLLDNVANTPEKKEKYLKTIYSKAQSMDFMIDDLLLYSKLDLKQIPFNFEKTDMVEFFQYCIFETCSEFERYNIHINLKNKLSSSIYVSIDRERMRRVIINILENSRKYMNKENGEICIELRETISSIIIELRDNGAGISEEYIDKIFDKFYRGDAARSEAKGSGLGLAIAKSIVEGHGGKIWAVGHGKEGISIIISLAKWIGG